MSDEKLYGAERARSFAPMLEAYPGQGEYVEATAKWPTPLPCTFWVPGTPRPQGSKNYFVNKHTGRAQGKESSDATLKGWRDDIRAEAGRAGLVFADRGVPVALSVVFVFARSKSHYLPANRRRPHPVLRGDAPVLHTNKPDAEKLTRALKDALKGVAYLDDSQVAEEEVMKAWGARPGAAVTLWLPDADEMDGIRERVDLVQTVAR